MSALPDELHVIVDAASPPAASTAKFASPHHFTTVLDALMDGVFVMQAVREATGELVDFECVYANDAAGRIHGVPAHHLVHRRLRAMADDGDASFRAYRGLLETGEPLHMTVPWEDPDTGRVRAVLEFNATRLGDGFVVAVRDIKQRVDAIEQVEVTNARLAQTIDALERANSAQRDFLAVASHELKTPMTAVNGFVELLLNNWDQLDDTRRREYLTTIHNNARRQALIVDDVLDAARIQSGRLELTPGPCAVGPLVNDALSSILDSADVIVDIPADLVVMADHTRAVQVLVNLLSNALKYGSSPIVMTARTDGDVGAICVEDAGPGVPDDFVAELFEPFSQASRGERREARGTGLGLYLSRELALAMDGDIRYSRVDGVTRFGLRLPLPT